MVTFCFRVVLSNLLLVCLFEISSLPFRSATVGSRRRSCGPCQRKSFSADYRSHPDERGTPCLNFGELLLFFTIPFISTSCLLYNAQHIHCHAAHPLDCGSRMRHCPFARCSSIFGVARDCRPQISQARPHGSLSISSANVSISSPWARSRSWSWSQFGELCCALVSLRVYLLTDSSRDLDAIVAGKYQRASPSPTRLELASHA